MKRFGRGVTGISKAKNMRCWVRPASMWNEMVTRDGKTQRRFTYVGEEA